MKTNIQKTPIEGLLVVEINPFRDERGYFIEYWQENDFRSAGFPDVKFVQSNESQSGAKVLRGLHYQNTKEPMGKLVRCTIGAILDVAVDLRINSKTFGQWYGVELSEENMKQLWVPVGFAHGFATLSDKARVQYMCTGFYSPEAEGAIVWNDKDVGVDWPFPDPVISDKDKKNPTLKDYQKNPAFKD